MSSNGDKERLKELRESLNYSVDEFAKIIGIHRSSLYRYEGTNKAEPRELPISIALKISREFNVSLDWLAGSSDIKHLNQTPNKLTEIYDSLSDIAKQELFSYAIYLQTKEDSNK